MPPMTTQGVTGTQTLWEGVYVDVSCKAPSSGAGGHVKEKQSEDRSWVPPRPTWKGETEKVWTERQSLLQEARPQDTAEG